MVRAMARLAVVLLAAACCGTTGPAPAGGPSQPAPVIVSPAPATSTGSPTAPPPPPASPLALEACGEIIHYQDGNAGPVLCPDGRPSQTADAYYRSLLPALAVLRVGADANLDDVETAMCADKTFAHLTNPMEESAYRLAAAEQGWGFGDEPVAWLIRQAC